MFGGVLTEVGERLLEQRAVCQDGDVGGAVDIHLSPWSQSVGHRAQKRGDWNDLLSRTFDARLGAGKDEQGSGQAVETAARCLDVCEKAIAVSGVVLRPCLKHLHRARDRGERGLQFMRGVRHEVAFRPLSALAGADVLEGDDRASSDPRHAAFDLRTRFVRTLQLEADRVGKRRRQKLRHEGRSGL